MAALLSLGVRMSIILVCSLNTVSCEIEVKVYIGDVALLPCIYNNTVPDKVTISWRDKDNNNVLDIKENIPKLESQSEKFKGRVSFSDQYKKGNFSISLDRVQQGDAGVYECNIRVPDGPQQKVKLIVTGERPKKPPTPPARTGGAAAVTPASLRLLLLSAGLSVLLCSLTVNCNSILL
ncbi:hepatitis A virus cellular receptor 2-like isoform X3 [Thunnus albacares]|uniref:hepatitis A virus cellular receptor 2-like isoform X3 n=1 Tax=Thunnus albacares TaxID=8236 RepID=UPI001CF61034|nr:hepatitis A virus cellular receptor 2-like isoform X3 [Thunnus albacares]